MINRVLIRTKVVQMMYNYYVTRGTKELKAVMKELTRCFDDIYESYNYLLSLMVEMTHLQELNLDEAKYKYMPSDEDLNPSMRFVENEFIAALKNDSEYQEYMKDHPFSWFDNQPLLRLLLDKVVKSEPYATYMAMERTDYESDCQLWRQLMKDVLLPEENLLDHFQMRSVYTGEDDIAAVGQFVLKTIRRFEHHDEKPLLPQFKDDEDASFAPDLLSQSISNFDENNQLIDECVEKGRWTGDRIAVFDRVVMLVALTELRNFPKIPLVVTLNEYIEIAKSFSTAQSGMFVNGVLMAALTRLREQGSILKRN